MGTPFNSEAVNATVLQYHRACGVEGDMETAIEQSVSMYVQYEVVLLIDSGAVLIFHYLDSSTAYSIVPSYIEGEGGTDSEQSRPDSTYMHARVDLILPDVIVPVSVNDFLAYFAAKDLCDMNKSKATFSDAEEFLEDYAVPSGSIYRNKEGGDFGPVSSESVIHMIQLLGERVDPDTRVRIRMPEDLCRAYTALAKAAAERITNNTRVRIDNLGNAALARILRRIAVL